MDKWGSAFFDDDSYNICAIFAHSNASILLLTKINQSYSVEDAHTEWDFFVLSTKRILN